VCKKKSSHKKAQKAQNDFDIDRANSIKHFVLFVPFGG
jgi:hypothetical protein